MDTYAWIEYFQGSKKGKIVDGYLKEEIVTPSIVLIELSCKSEKERWNFEKHLEFIKSKSLIIQIDEEIIVKCGKIYMSEKEKKSRFGIIDAIILTIARKLKAKILTGDEHFEDLEETIMLR